MGRRRQLGDRAALCLLSGVALLAGGAPARVASGDATSAGPLAPVAYGNAQLDVPAQWPVVSPGTSQCGGSPAVAGVVLLGSFGSSRWCPPGSGQDRAPVATVVRLGPLPAGEPPFDTLPMSVRNGVAVYTVALAGPISGTAYLVPSLGAEVMVTGPGAAGIVDSVGPSVRARALTAGAVNVPAAWPRFSFAGLSFAVPPGWGTTRTNQVFDCQKETDSVGLLSPPAVILDTDTSYMPLPCPYFPPPRSPANGLVVDVGSARAPNVLPPGAVPLALNGLQFLLDRADALSVLVLEVKVPGRNMPVAVRIGLGNSATAARVLHSIERA